MSDQENDYTLLRPFDLTKVMHGARVCDARGRILTNEGAAELLSLNGVESLRLAPLCWLEGKPVYPDSELDIVGVELRADSYSPTRLVLFCTSGHAKWPAEKVKRVVTIAIDGVQVIGYEVYLPKNTELVSASLEWSKA